MTNLRRLEHIRTALCRKKLDGLIVSGLTNIRYLTGFSGSSALLIILPDALHFFTDSRYAEQAQTELFPLPGLTIHSTRELWKFIGEQKLLAGCQILGFEAGKVTFATVQLMRKHLKPARLRPCSGIIEEQTAIKAPEEVECIRRAADIGAAVFEYILNFVKPGMMEKDVAAEISYQAKKWGSEGDAFDIIVASGVRGALPHGRASTKRLEQGELVTLDFGCTVQGFHSDLTRTFALGTPNDTQVKIYELVLEANKRAIQRVHGGLLATHIDGFARSVITDAGYGEYFVHSLGHGLGLDVHESPSVSAFARRVRVPVGAVITIEPGVYLPGQCGVRIEDDVWLSEQSCEVLTGKAPKECIIV